MKRNPEFAVFLFCVVICIAGIPVFAQTQGQTQTQTQGQTTTPEKNPPAPYEKSEFPDWMLKVRRAEILAAGSFPFALFFTGFAYDSYRFVYHGLADGTWSGDYLPWPFKGPNGVPLETNERKGVLLVSAGLSIGLAVADYFLGKETSKRERQRKAVEEQFKNAGNTSIPSTSAGGAPAAGTSASGTPDATQGQGGRP